MSVQAYVGLGGNVGDVLGAFAATLLAMPARGLAVRRCSAAYLTDALVPDGAPAAPPYWNAVCEVACDLEPEVALGVLLQLESEAGRVRRARWESRPLDLDLLLFGARRIDRPELRIPHPELQRRRFVLEPLCELAPELVVPGLDATVRELLRRLPEGGVREVRPLPG